MCSEWGNFLGYLSAEWWEKFTYFYPRLVPVKSIVSLRSLPLWIFRSGKSHPFGCVMKTCAPFQRVWLLPFTLRITCNFMPFLSIFGSSSIRISGDRRRKIPHCWSSRSHSFPKKQNSWESMYSDLRRKPVIKLLWFEYKNLFIHKL